jgi:hypothetical protein
MIDRRRFRNLENFATILVEDIVDDVVVGDDVFELKRWTTFKGWVGNDFSNADPSSIYMVTSPPFTLTFAVVRPRRVGSSRNSNRRLVVRTQTNCARLVRSSYSYEMDAFDMKLSILAIQGKDSRC